MKYLFFLLVLFNIVFYLWETGVGRSTKQEDRPPSTDSVERIVLARELPKPPAQSPEPRVASEDAAKSQQTPLPEQAAAEPTKPLAGQQPTEPPAQPQTQEPAPPPVEQTPACYRLGPYTISRQAQAALRKLGAGAGKAVMVKKPVEVEKGYLILYPAADSLKTAQANRKMLAQKGLKNVWVIDKGESRYAISLGAFGNKEQAGEALGRFLAQGIQAELKPRLGMADRWWLEAPGEPGRAALETVAGLSATQADQPAVKVCD